MELSANTIPTYTFRAVSNQILAGMTTAAIIFFVILANVFFGVAHAQKANSTTRNSSSTNNILFVDSDAPQNIALKNHLEIWQAFDTPSKESQWIEDSDHWHPFQFQQQPADEKFLRLKVFNRSSRNAHYKIISHSTSLDRLAAISIDEQTLNIPQRLESKNFTINPGIKHNNLSIFLPAEESVTVGFYFNGNDETIDTLHLKEITSYNVVHARQQNIWFFITGIALSTLVAVIFMPFIASTLIKNNILAFAVLYGAVSCGLVALPAYYLFFNNVSLSTFLQYSACLQMISLINYAWIVNSSLSLHYTTKRYSTFFLIALNLLCIILSATIPINVFIKLAQTSSILVTFGLCIYTIILYLKKPVTLAILALTIIKAVLLFFLIQLKHNHELSYLSFHNYHAIQSGIVWLEILCVLLLIKASLQSSFNQKRKLALNIAKQEQKVASITPFVKASRHDLRAPLSDIIGLSELVADHPLDQRQRKFILDIQQVARNALDNINNLFSYSQANNSNREKNNKIILEPFDLNNLVSECTQYYASHIAAKNKELILDMTEYHSDYLIGDHEKIRQLFMHIIEYCIVVCDAKDLYIKIKLPNEKNLSINFVCEPIKFIRAQKEHYPPALQLSNALTQQMQGNFHIDNIQGNLNINIAIQDSGQKTNVASSTEKLIGKRVLVVDDNLTSCEIICSYLNRWQISSVYATNNIEAAAILRHHNSINDPFDLLIIDYLLPEKNGIEFVIQIKQDPSITHSLAILMMSNASHMIDKRLARNCGINHILEKPVIADTLKLALLEEFLLNDPVTDRLNEDNQIITASETKIQDQKKQRFLLIEDNSISAKITSTHLKELNIDYDLIDTGEAALQYIRKNEYSVILLDCQLPDQSGFEVAKKIRDLEKSKRDSRKKLFVVALTAESSEDYKQQCLNAGMDSFITKPINKKQIQSLLDKFSI